MPPPYVWDAEFPLGFWRLDLVCWAARLVVEVDGPEHRRADQHAKDQDRDQKLRGMGLATLRVTNTEVLADPVGVAMLVFKRACQRTHELVPTNPRSPYYGWTTRAPLIP